MSVVPLHWNSSIISNILTSLFTCNIPGNKEKRKKKVNFGYLLTAICRNLLLANEIREKSTVRIIFESLPTFSDIIKLFLACSMILV